MPFRTLSLLAAIALAVTLAVAGAVRAEPEQPEAEGAPTREEAPAHDGTPESAEHLFDDEEPAERREMFSLRPSAIYAGFEMDYELRRVRTNPLGRAASTHRNRDLRLKEVFGIGLAGHIVDPDVVEYRANFEFGLAHGRFTEKSDARGTPAFRRTFRHTDSDTGVLLRYDVSLDALRNEPISVRAFARRFDERIPRRFLPSLHELRTEAGISVLALTGPVTTEVGFTWHDVERRGNRLREDDERLQSHRIYLDSRWQIADHHSLRLNYEHQREDTRYQGSQFRFRTDRDELRVEHDLAFGSKAQHRFDTFLRYNEERGDLARDELEFVPRLSLQHTDKLRTVYRYGLYDTRQGAIDLTQHKFDVQALYQATPDLRLNLNSFGLYERIQRDITTTEYGIGADASYRRDTSLGELNANLALAYQRSSTKGDAGKRFVRNEAHSMTDARQVFLRQLGVRPESVIAHDGRYTRIFIPGVDYTLNVVGGRAYVRRLPFGRINENDVVYFDYTYVVPVRAGVHTWRTDFLIEHRFTFGLTPYYHFEGRFQNVDRTSLGTPLRRHDQNRHRFGARYERDKGGEWLSHWNVGGEYEIFDDTILPYDAMHFNARAALLRQPLHTVDLIGSVSRYWFKGDFDRRRVWWMDLDLQDRLQINRYLGTLSGIGYRFQRDTLMGRTHAVDIQTGLSYTRNYLTVEFTLEYDLLSIAANRENSFGMYLNVKRDFAHLLPDGSSR